MLAFCAILAAATLAATLAAEAGPISTALVETPGKTLCLCLATLGRAKSGPDQGPWVVAPGGGRPAGGP